MRTNVMASLLFCAACSRASTNSPIQPEPSAGAMARPVPSAQVPPVSPGPSSSAEQAPPCAPETLRRGLALTLEQARKAMLTEAQLDGCAAAPLRCDDTQFDPTPGPCRIHIASAPDLTRISLLLPPRDGAPLRFEVWIDPQASRTGNVFRDASTWAALPDGSFLLRGETSHAIHDHGGKAAEIGTVRLRAYNQGKTPRKLEIKEATWNTNHGTAIRLNNVRLYDVSKKSLVEIQGEAEIPPGETSLLIEFASQKAYQSWGDQFFVEAQFTLDGHPLSPRSEIRVTRVEPLRHPH